MSVSNCQNTTSLCSRTEAECTIWRELISRITLAAVATRSVDAFAVEADLSVLRALIDVCNDPLNLIVLTSLVWHWADDRTGASSVKTCPVIPKCRGYSVCYERW